MKGFTLIELLAYSAIAALVLAFAALFAIGVMEANTKSSIREEVQRNAASILRTFDYETRHAQSVYTPTSDFIADPGRLSLETTINLPPGEDIGYLDMYIDNGRFCVKRELGGVSCITSDNVEVSSLVFTRLVQSGAQESAQMRATLRYRHASANFQFPETIQTTARLRAH